MSSNRDFENRLRAALADCEQLQEEIRVLKQLLVRNGIPLPGDSPIHPAPAEPCLAEPDDQAPVVAPDTNEGKIDLFRELFRGRDDVYAERWRTKAGEWAYRPASERNWGAFLSSRPEDRKRIDRQTRQYFPLTDEVLRQHLTGKKTVGIYPLLTDETCWFLAADFDKTTWQDDALAFVRTCHNMGVSAYLERSRSGNGGHVWIFFETAVSAALARKMACFFLTRTMERRHHLGLDSYDRFFPNQDTMPRGGFGNLIALPLQRMPRQVGNSVFVDDNMCPYPDQWRVLASIRRVSGDQVERFVSDAARSGQILGVRTSLADGESEDEPWNLSPSRRLVAPIQGPFPDSVEIVLSNMIFIPKAGLPEPMLNRILRMAAFQNPEFYKTQAMRLSTWDKPRVIRCGEEFPQHLALPRGCLQEVRGLLKDHGIQLAVRDERFLGRSIDVTFRGTLRDEQIQAIRQTLRHDEGVLCAPTAFGKTVAAAKLIAERRVATLILVHRRQLLDQWRARLAVFLDVSMKSIGQIAGGKVIRTGVIDVALIQSLQRKGEVRDFVADYGHVIVDECHHLAAFSFEQVMKQVKRSTLWALPQRRREKTVITRSSLCNAVRCVLA